jgi:hypothetical protein
MTMPLFVHRLLLYKVFNSYSLIKTMGKNSPRCMLLLCSLLLFLLSGCDTRQMHPPGVKSVLPSHTFPVTARPSLAIHNDSGSVALHTGRDNIVVVTATQHVDSFPDFTAGSSQDIPDAKDMQLNYDQEGNTINVEALNISNAALRAVSVDFDVIVPPGSDIEIYTGYGAIDVDGVHGKMALESREGDVSVQNSEGAVTINSTNGSVNAANVQGPLSLTLDNGDIALQHVSLAGSSQITVEHGSIDFDGSINPHGNYRFHTDTGSIDLTLPTSSSFDLDAATEYGNIENEFGSTHIGSDYGPRALLHVSSDFGSIVLHYREK